MCSNLNQVRGKSFLLQLVIVYHGARNTMEMIFWLEQQNNWNMSSFLLYFKGDN